MALLSHAIAFAILPHAHILNPAPPGLMMMSEMRVKIGFVQVRGKMQANDGGVARNSNASRRPCTDGYLVLHATSE